MDIPIKNLLKKRSQKELALLQDEVVDLLYSVDSKAVFHGGTCIWRCYNGKRFSQDLDFYLIPKKDFKNKFEIEAKKRGLEIIKFKKTENSIFSKISNEITLCSLELALRKKKGELTFYNKADGNTINIFAISKENLLIEKTKAFMNRKLIRDVYDVFFLINSVKNKKIKDELSELVSSFPEPKDEKNLKTLVYSGTVPSYKQMLVFIKRCLK